MSEAAIMDMRHSIIDFVYGTNDFVILSDLLERINIVLGQKEEKYSSLVSPSGDEWFDDPNNIKDLDEGVRQLKEGKSSVMSMDEINSILGL
ncbi:MAG: hypothetical protein MJZ66_07360 [Bacteroidales bacterium]|nr:hypothetical protein [Bacteroidales bacterium]